MVLPVSLIFLCERFHLSPKSGRLFEIEVHVHNGYNDVCYPFFYVSKFLRAIA
jgi:hypothetical protein